MKIFKLNKLTPLQRRFLTFILGCVGVRLLLVHAVRKAKKVITADTSYNSDYLGEGVELLSFTEWNADKGIDISKIADPELANQLINAHKAANNFTINFKTLFE